MQRYLQSLKSRFLSAVKKTANDELAAGNTQTAAACAEIARAIKSVRVPAESGCEGNRGSRRRRQK